MDEVDGGGVQGRVVIVTGAGQGIGQGMALHLAEHGARIVVAELEEHRAEATVAAIRGLGGDALAVTTDVQDRASVRAMVEATVEAHGRLDGLINNAHTFTPRRPLLEVGDEDLETNLRSGVCGALWAMQAAHPHMAARGWGRIVNFVSAAGITGMAGYGAYNIAKEGARALTRTAAREWGRDGIVVNAIAPGAASKRGKDAAEHGSEAFETFLRTHPMGRQGDPREDIAPVARFLCSDACRFVTGMTFMVDGGAFIHA